jgi:hypothetical protein
MHILTWKHTHIDSNTYMHAHIKIWYACQKPSHEERSLFFFNNVHTCIDSSFLNMIQWKSAQILSKCTYWGPQAHLGHMMHASMQCTCARMYLRPSCLTKVSKYVAYVVPKLHRPKCIHTFWRKQMFCVCMWISNYWRFSSTLKTPLHVW